MKVFNVLLAIILGLLAHVISLVAGNSITIYSWDRADQWVCSTTSVSVNGGRDGKQPDGQVCDFTTTKVPASGSVNIYPPQGWIGTIHTVYSLHNCHNPRIIAEVTFQGFAGLTYYDVSAVDNCCDNYGIHWILTHSLTATPSCCVASPCSGSYTKPHDVQTKFTGEVDLIIWTGRYYGW